MKERGYRDASIEDYLKAIGLYLRTLKTITPSIEDAKEYHSNMAASNLARSTVNIRRAALLAFYRSHGQELKLPYLKPNNQIGSSLFQVGRLNCNFPSLRYIISIRFFVVLKPLALLFAD
jgi:hypothetical protein